MDTIKRDVYVLRDTLKSQIQCTDGTNAVTIELTVRDFTIPASAAAVVYSLGQRMATPNKLLADISGNTISFTPTEGFFAAGLNALQIRVIDGNKKLISFQETVKCFGKLRFDDETEAQQSTLIEQLLAKMGSIENKAETDLSGVEAKIKSLDNKKADKSDLTSPFNYKGTCLSTALPASGNKVNDTYFCTDLQYRMTWNGSGWFQSSLDESKYQDNLNALAAVDSELRSDLGDSNKYTLYDVSNPNFGNFSKDYEISGTKGSSFAIGAVKLSAGTFKELRVFIYGNDSNNWVLLGKTYALGEMLEVQAQENFTKVRLYVIINEKSLRTACTIVFSPQNDSIKSSVYFLQSKVYSLQSKVFHQNVITVGKEGCDYNTINEAVYNAHDSKEFPVTILIYPGVYDEVIISLNRYLSFIGVNRETCIIRDTSGKYANCPIKISGGEWTLENLSFIATAENAGSWVPTWENFDFPSYAIHVDGGGSGKGYIRNCTAYSECINAIGMGLHNDETVTIENCTIERNVKNNEYDSIYYQGALACHSTTNRTEPEKNEFLIVRNCEIISNTSKAVQLFSYTLGSPWKFGFEGCTFEANGKVNDTVYFRRGTEAQSLMPRSHGNNAKELNSNS